MAYLRSLLFIFIDNRRLLALLLLTIFLQTWTKAHACVTFFNLLEITTPHFEIYIDNLFVLWSRSKCLYMFSRLRTFSIISLVYLSLSVTLLGRENIWLIFCDGIWCNEQISFLAYMIGLHTARIITISPFGILGD